MDTNTERAERGEMLVELRACITKEPATERPWWYRDAIADILHAFSRRYPDRELSEEVRIALDHALTELWEEE